RPRGGGPILSAWGVPWRPPGDTSVRSGGRVAQWPPVQREVGLPRGTRKFQLVSDHAPTGDQPQAIEALVAGLQRGEAHQVLLGITGSGKTFTMANVIARVNRPTLVLAP